MCGRVLRRQFDDALVARDGFIALALCDQRVAELTVCLRDIGKEFGSTTGRPRRCGWLDLVALKYSLMLNGVTQLIMTKTDVLDTFETIKVATAYSIEGELTDQLPYDLDADVKPVFTEMAGWQTDLTGVRTKDQFPRELNEYIRFLEKELQVPVKYISVGPDREQIIEL